MKHLFEPFKIKNLELKNRLVIPAMSTQYCAKDGTVTDRYLAYHEARAKGGWGLIITENHVVDAYAGAMSRLPGLWNDEQIESHRRLTDMIHRYDTKVCCQIYHAGRVTRANAYEGPKMAPSPIRDSTHKELPRAMTKEEIQTVVKQFGDAAWRAKEAGFDMVELHGGHGYLITQFLSRFSNKRHDEYGGSLTNRCRFLLEVIHEVRSRVGDDFPIQLRISSVENVDGGLSLSESMAIAQMAEAAGIDSIHVSQGNYEDSTTMVSPCSVAPGAFISHAAAIKRVVSIPVIGVGRINDPYIAEAALASGSMDLVAMGRASLADPEMPNKAKEGRFDEITHCFGCVQGCFGKAGMYSMGCFANPAVGYEYTDPYKPSENKRRVFVAGGGIAGCEAAIVAARKGHSVTLWEESNTLGGQWNAASMPPGKAELQALLLRQRRELEQYGVTVKLDKQLTETTLLLERPDVLLVATGSTPARPPIPGLGQRHVVLPAEILCGEIPVKKNIVIIGGGLVGAETADYAAQQGSNVSIIEMLPSIAKDGEAGPRKFLLKNLKERNVAMYTEATCKEIGENFVRFEIDGEEKTIQNVDQVILAAGLCSKNTLAESGAKLGIETICIGDAATPKNGISNLWEAFDVASKL